MISHRPPDELLLGYASGSLPEPIALAIAAHAALCPDTARALRRYEGLGGTLLAGLEPAELNPGALDRTFAALESAATAPPPLAVTPETRAMLPAPLWPYVKGDIASVTWRQRTAHLETAELVSDGARHTAFLLRAKAGKSVPRHTHRGLELTLVLAGAFCDAAECFERGDIQVADATIDHQPTAQPGEDCICLVALEAPLWFTGPIGRLANPFVKL